MKIFMMKSLVAIATIAVLTSCNKEKSLILQDSNVINVTAHVNSLTKAGYEGTSNLPETFCMDISQGADAKYDYSLVEMTRNQSGNGYTASTEMVWAEEDHSSVSVKAMTVPYGLTSIDKENPMTVNVSLEQDVEENLVASDLLGSATGNGVTISGNTIAIGFNHLLTKLEVTYEFGAGFESGQVTVNSMSLHNVCIRGGYSYASMSIASGVSLGYGDVEMYHDSASSKAEAIFFPYMPSENPTLQINATAGSTEYNLSCPVAVKDGNGFVGGKRYKMKVTIVGSNISETTASIARGWDVNTDEQSFVTE